VKSRSRARRRAARTFSRCAGS